jgi:hypothetical protein
MLHHLVPAEKTPCLMNSEVIFCACPAIDPERTLRTPRCISHAGTSVGPSTSATHRPSRPYRARLGAMTISVSTCSLKTPAGLRLSSALDSSASNALALSPNSGLAELDIE